MLGVLEESGFVHRSDASEGSEAGVAMDQRILPSDAVSLRSISSDNFVVVDTTHGADVIARPASTVVHLPAREGDLSVEAVLYQSRSSTSRDARPTCARSTATTTPTRSRTRR